MSKIQTAITKLTNARAAAVASIEGIDIKITELTAKLEAEPAADALAAEREATGYAVGTHVVVQYGRGETRTEKRGVVVAFAPKTGTVPGAYAVQAGGGVNTKIIKAAAISVVKAEETPAA